MQKDFNTVKQQLTQPAFSCSKLTIETLEQRCEICSKLTIKTFVFIVNFEHISHICCSVSIANFEYVIADCVYCKNWLHLFNVFYMLMFGTAVFFINSSIQESWSKLKNFTTVLIRQKQHPTAVNNFGISQVTQSSDGYIDVCLNSVNSPWERRK